MTEVFYLSAAVALVATFMVVTRAHAVHALLYLVVSLLAIAMVFYVLGAPFAAALEVIVYAGAIVVLFVFVVMMLGVGRDPTLGARRALEPGAWLGPALLALVLATELGYVLLAADQGDVSGQRIVEAKEVGVRLFGPYLLAVELASLLLLAALVGAYHLGRRLDDRQER
jgi:NADH-quinone oxidoreductase subunit J